MSRVITFSRQYPSYHPKAGQPTYFIEKVWNSICWDKGVAGQEFPIPYHIGVDFRSTDDKKHHTIRAGHRWKAGDWFSPRVWSGKPYRSKMIQFAPDIQIKKVWDFQIIKVKDGILSSYEMIVKGNNDLPLYGFVNNGHDLMINDGLEYNDFCDWFKMDSAKKDIHFDGQIICWNENIEY